MAQFLIAEVFLNERDVGILSLRKTRPAVRSSCWALVRKILGAEGVPYEQNRTELALRYVPLNNRWAFDGLDNVFKKRSMEGINYVWVEEAAGIGHDATFTEREFDQLDMLCRAEGRKQIFLTYNPIDPVGNEWLKLRQEQAAAHSKSRVLRLLHTDNAMLDETGHAVIERLIAEDSEYGKIYGLGEWAMPQALIFRNWDIVNAMPEKYDVRVWGLDFGYSINPAALVECCLSGSDLYIAEHVYATGLLNTDLAAMLKNIVPPSEIIVADSAEPKSIAELRRTGLNIFPSVKGPDSVAHGIRTLQGLMIHITADSASVEKEFRGYKWSVDMEGTVISPPRPAPFHDHAIDAVRYAVAHVKGLVPAGLQIVAIPNSIEGHDIWDDAGWQQ